MATWGVYILGGSLAAIGRHHGTHRSFDMPSFSVLYVAMERSEIYNSNASGFVKNGLVLANL